MVRTNHELRVRRRSANPTPIVRYRNLQAVQGALLRGDTEVVLLNESKISSNIWDCVREVHDRDLGLRARYDKHHGIFAGRNAMSERKEEKKEAREIGRVNWRGFKLDFVKMLGGGGVGFAALYTVTFEGGETKQIVIKHGRTELWDSDLEAEFHLRYDGNPHVMRCLHLNQMAITKGRDYKNRYPSAHLKYTNGETFDSMKLDVLVLEFAHFGDMSTLMAKLDKNNVVMSTRVLWGIWECLVKLVAAVAYQPAFHQKGKIFEVELLRAEKKGTVSQFLRKLKDYKISHDIHFDQDESNILVARDKNHKTHPIFKLHDLGTFSHKMDEYWSDGDFPEIKYWRDIRPISKPMRTTPEQMHEDWDELETDIPVSQECDRFRGADLTRGTKVAGRFGVWSNIFIMARNMEGVITFCFSMHPLTSQKYRTLDGKKKKKSYGWRMLEDKYNWLDKDLCDTLMQCLFEKPIDRPDVITLLKQIEERKRKGFNMPRDRMEDWWTKHVGSLSTNTPIPEVSERARRAEDPARQAMADGMGIAAAMDGRVGASFGDGMDWDGPRPPARDRAGRRDERKHRDAHERRGRVDEDNAGAKQTEDLQRRLNDLRVGQAFGRSAVVAGPSPQLEVVKDKKSTTGKGSKSSKKVSFAFPLGQPAQNGIRKRAQKTKTKTKRTRAQHKFRAKTTAIELLVQQVLPDMPVALRNLVVRAQDLDERIRQGSIPRYAFVR